MKHAYFTDTSVNDTLNQFGSLNQFIYIHIRLELQLKPIYFHPYQIRLKSYNFVSFSDYRMHVRWSSSAP